MAALHPLVSFYAGDEFQIAGSLFDQDGTPIGLTGAAIEWKLATLDRSVVLDYSIGGGIAVTDAANGLILITVSEGDSAKLSPGRYRDQLRVTTSTGVLSTQWVGFIDVKQPL